VSDQAPQSDLSDDERADAVVQAKRAQVKHEPELRRLGAIGTVGIGLNPKQPTWRQWWARCLVRPEAGLAVPLLAEGYGTADEAMEALVDLAARPRLDT
jgi:hypothetical protein